ncbi:MAG: HAD family phosphatase [Rubrobacteraceae bacterium]
MKKVSSKVQAEARWYRFPPDLEGAFAPIVYPSEVSATKPDPAPYLEMLDRLGIEADEAMAFEDSSSGIASAVGAGIQTVGIASTHDPQKMRGAGAFVVSTDFTDPKCVALLER